MMFREQRVESFQPAKVKLEDLYSLNVLSGSWKRPLGRKQ